MTTQISYILDRLDNVEKIDENKWRACCPAHDDKHPSLDIDVKGDKVLLICRSQGCTVEEIVSSLGLCMSDLFPLRRDKTRIERIYDYVDAEGSIVHQTLRLTPKGRFPQRRPDPDTPGKCIRNLKGIEKVLYNLPAVLRADGWIFFCEGEKSADAVANLGLTATCNAGGSSSRWTNGYTKSLAGKQVCILPDDDKPGRTYAYRVGNALLDKASDVRVLSLYDEGDSKKDPEDWVRGGGKKKALLELAEATEPYEGTEVEESSEGVLGWKLRTLVDAYKPRPRIKFWVDGVFEENSLNIIYGRSAAFKSMLMTDCALSVASGVDWLPPTLEEIKLGGPLILTDEKFGTVEAKKVTQAPVMWIDMDQGMRRTEDRIEALARRKFDKDVDISTIPIYYDSHPSPLLCATDDGLMLELIELLLKNKIKMLFVDHLGATSGSADPNTADMLPVMNNWRQLIEAAGTTVVMIAHPRKGDESSQDALRGFSGIMNAIDLALQIKKQGPKSPFAEVHCTKARGSPVDSFGTEFRFQWKPDSKDLKFAQFFGVKIETKESATIEALRNIIQMNPELGVEATIVAAKDKVESAGKYKRVGKEFVRGLLKSQIGGGSICEDRTGERNAKRLRLA